MSYGRLLFLLAAVVAVSAGTEDSLDNIALRTGGVLITSAENSTSTSDKCSERYECASCTESRVCAPEKPGGDFIEILRTKCIAPTPFCDYTTGSCSAEMSPVCAEHDEFKCVRDGVFPHPRSCNKFYHCVSLKSSTYMCPTGTYCPKSQNCSEYNSCYKFNCYGKNGVKVPHAAAPEYFAYCVSNTAIFVDRCTESDISSEANQSCKPYCTTHGLLEDTKDKTWFYKCSDDFGKLVMTHHKCPNEEVFNAKRGQCQPLLSTRKIVIKP